MKKQELINKIQSLEKEKRNLIAANESLLTAFRAVGESMRGNHDPLVLAYQKLIESIRAGETITEKYSDGECSSLPDGAPANPNF